jgi:hypothetical protein
MKILWNISTKPAIKLDPFHKFIWAKMPAPTYPVCGAKHLTALKYHLNDMSIAMHLCSFDRIT